LILVKLFDDLGSLSRFRAVWQEGRVVIFLHRGELAE